MKKIVLILAVFLLPGLLSAQKRFNPDCLKIDRIDVVSFPCKKGDGNNWDNALSGNYPDVYYKIQDLTYNLVVYELESKQRVENFDCVKLPYNVFPTGVIWLKNLNAEFSIDFYDFDSLTQPDYLCSVKFKPKDYVEKYKKIKSQKLKGNNGLEIEIFFTWYDCSSEKK